MQTLYSNEEFWAAIENVVDIVQQSTGALTTQLFTQGQTIAANQSSLLKLLEEILALLKQFTAVPQHGAFNPPPGLVKTQTVEITMSVLQIEVGQTATGVLTFSEATPPTNGAVASDSPAVTVSLAADGVTWTCVGVSVTATPANVTYTGTSAPPDVGPAQVAPMTVTVVPVPVAETGDFNPSGATITGP